MQYGCRAFSQLLITEAGTTHALALDWLSTDRCPDTHPPGGSSHPVAAGTNTALLLFPAVGHRLPLRVHMPLQAAMVAVLARWGVHAHCASQVSRSVAVLVAVPPACKAVPPACKAVLPACTAVPPACTGGPVDAHKEQPCLAAALLSKEQRCCQAAQLAAPPTCTSSRAAFISRPEGR